MNHELTINIPFGSAIVITKKNRKKLSILNNGVVPKLEDRLSIFVWLYEDHAEILSLADFDDMYDWCYRMSDTSFVPIAPR